MARRMRITKNTPLAVIVIMLIITVGQHYSWFNLTEETLPQVKSAITESEPGLYRVVQFSDGDTIQIDMNGKTEKVRLLGVDTPETNDPRKSVQCYGQAASAFTKQLIGTNSVRIASDPLNANRDRYSRLLRYVYLPDGTLVNAEIIKQGYGFAYLNFPFTKSDEFRKHEIAAKEAGKGLWSNCQPAQNKSGGYTSNDASQGPSQ